MAGKLLNVQEYDLPLLTYEAVPRTCMPPLFDRDNTCGFSIYPYTLVLSNRREPVRKVYRSVVVENESLRVTVIPDLGGRVYQIEDRETGAAYLHDNRCVRPVRIPPRWNFLSLGMELNFPYTHSPTGTDPVAYELIRDDEAEMVGVAVGEQEKQWGLSWRVSVRITIWSRHRYIICRIGSMVLVWMVNCFLHPRGMLGSSFQDGCKPSVQQDECRYSG